MIYTLDIHVNYSGKWMICSGWLIQ